MDTKITFQKVLVSLSFHCPPRIVCQRIWFYCGGVSCYFRGFVRFQHHLLPWLAPHVLFVVPQTSRGCSFSKVEAIIYVENIVQSKTDKDSQIVFLTDALSATAAKYKLPNWKKTFLWVTFAVRKLCQQNKGQKHRKKTVASAHVYHNHIYLQTPTTTWQLPAAVKTGTRDLIYTLLTLFTLLTGQNRHPPPEQKTPSCTILHAPLRRRGTHCRTQRNIKAMLKSDTK